MVSRQFKKELVKIENHAIGDWFERVMDTYPADTANMLKRQKDPFSNPIGSTTLTSLKSLYGMLTGDLDKEAVANALDPIIRIRAVQAFTPSHATGFTVFLKNILRDQFKSRWANGDFIEEWFHLEQRIDTFGLIAFDIFIKCREQIYKLKVSTDREKTYRAFARAGLITGELDGDQPDSESF